MHGLSIGEYALPSAVITRSPRPSTGPEVDEQHLVLAVIDDLAQHVAAAREVGRR